MTWLGWDLKLLAEKSETTLICLRIDSRFEMKLAAIAPGLFSANSILGCEVPGVDFEREAQSVDFADFCFLNSNEIYQHEDG